MKADLYVQGHHWATIEVPGDSLLSLLAQGMITRANLQAAALHKNLLGLPSLQCSISIRINEPVTYSPDTELQKPPAPTENTHGN